MNGRIALFVHHPMCSVQSVNGIISSLTPHYSFKIFTKHELEYDFLDDVDIIAFPGGFGDSDSFDYLLPKNIVAIKKFLARGGRYLGICMGAYWADKDYFDILDSVRAVQYIKRPNTDTRRPHAKAVSVTWEGQPLTPYFYDGCALIGDRSKFETIATYANGDPMAIIQNRIGIMGCHLESEHTWYDYYSWMPKHWHHKQHNVLLLEFVNKLMSR